jgi:hypothetical protein
MRCRWPCENQTCRQVSFVNSQSVACPIIGVERRDPAGQGIGSFDQQELAVRVDDAGGRILEVVGDLQQDPSDEPLVLDAVADPGHALEEVWAELGGGSQGKGVAVPQIALAQVNGKRLHFLQRGSCAVHSVLGRIFGHFASLRQQLIHVYGRSVGTTLF